MLLIRRFEEKVEERFRAGELPGFLHVCIGQEAVAVGVIRSLEEGDVIASTHRAHGHALAKGTHPNEVMAEPLTGSSRAARTGTAARCISTTSSAGTWRERRRRRRAARDHRRRTRVQVPGRAPRRSRVLRRRRDQHRHRPRVAEPRSVVVRPGCVRVREQPLGGVDPASQHLPIKDLSKRAVAYGMESMTVDGQDVQKVYATATKAVEHALRPRPGVPPRRDVPVDGHYIGDPQVYRPKNELKELRETQDPVDKLRGAGDLRRRVRGVPPRGDGASSRARSSSPRTARDPAGRRLKNVHA